MPPVENHLRTHRIAIIDISPVYSAGLANIFTADDKVDITIFKSPGAFQEKHTQEAYHTVCIHVYPTVVTASLQRLLSKLRKTDPACRVLFYFYQFKNDEFSRLRRLRADAVFLAGDDPAEIRRLIFNTAAGKGGFSAGLLNAWLKKNAIRADMPARSLPLSAEEWAGLKRMLTGMRKTAAHPNPSSTIKEQAIAGSNLALLEKILFKLSDL